MKKILELFVCVVCVGGKTFKEQEEDYNLIVASKKG